MLQKLAKFVGGKAGVFGNLAHGEGIDRIVTWDLNNADAVAHRDVLALSDDNETAFAQGTLGSFLSDPRKPWHIK